MDLGFSPFERGCGLWVAADKAIDGFPQLPGVGAAEMAQGLTAENAEPYLHQVEPGSVGGNEVQMNVGVTRPPAVPLRRVGIEIVHDDVQLPSGMGRDHIVHEVEKLTPPAAVVMSHLHLA